MALEREASLEQAKTQIEVDWQRRCEDTERDVVGKQEELVTNLAKARDEVHIPRLDHQGIHDYQNVVNSSQF